MLPTQPLTNNHFCSSYKSECCLLSHSRTTISVPRTNRNVAYSATHEHPLLFLVQIGMLPTQPLTNNHCCSSYKSECAKMWQVHHSSQWSCSNIMILQWNKWTTLNVQWFDFLLSSRWIFLAVGFGIVHSQCFTFCYTTHRGALLPSVLRPRHSLRSSLGGHSRAVRCRHVSVELAVGSMALDVLLSN